MKAIKLKRAKNKGHKHLKLQQNSPSLPFKLSPKSSDDSSSLDNENVSSLLSSRRLMNNSPGLSIFQRSEVPTPDLDQLNKKNYKIKIKKNTKKLNFLRGFTQKESPFAEKLKLNKPKTANNLQDLENKIQDLGENL